MSASESLTVADVFLGVEEESLGALTGEAAWCVPAQTVLTQQPVHHALINICRWRPGRQKHVQTVRLTSSSRSRSPSNGVAPSSRPTDAVLPRQVHLKAFVARALVRPQHVLAHAILADVGVEGALVNI